MTQSPLFDAPLPVARYQFRARMRHALQLPPYPGSLLRGQWGAALRRSNCATGRSHCSGCAVRDTCPYATLFEGLAPPAGQHSLQDFSHAPNPYVMEPPSAQGLALVPGDDLCFSMVLVGKAMGQLSIVVDAVQRMLGQGLTDSRAQAVLLEVTTETGSGSPTVIWASDRPEIQNHDARLVVPPPGVERTSIALDFQTPLRLQRQGRVLGPRELEPVALIAALARRTALLLEFHAGRSHFGAQAQVAAHMAPGLRGERHMRWHDNERYSSRQGREVPLGGAVGRWTLTGHASVMAALWPWLWLGQWLHVGKGATMGLGRYILLPAGARHDQENPASGLL